MVNNNVRKKATSKQKRSKKHAPSTENLEGSDFNCKARMLAELEFQMVSDVFCLMLFSFADVIIFLIIWLIKYLILICSKLNIVYHLAKGNLNEHLLWCRMQWVMILIN